MAPRRFEAGEAARGFSPVIANGVLTRVAVGLISAAPLAVPRMLSRDRGGLLFEIVEKREGMRGRRPWGRLMFARDCERLEALVWVYL